jgi:glutamate/tyrosine decarboxylase-like PLP-dependent enzyme
VKPGPREALRAWFLGPRAENADLLERMITEALRDHIFWRRNYHPEDGFTIRETDKRTPGYEEAVATLTQELMGLLAELKRGVPFFTGRYKGHMNFEQTIASQVGYFAAMLYNPNNVAIEASPVTTRLELEVARQLAVMIGYDPEQSWGHIASGGTVANFEALWVARNIIYFPIAATGAADQLGVELSVRTARGERRALRNLELSELVNIRNDDALELWHQLWGAAPHAAVHAALNTHSLQTLGYQDYVRRLAAAYGDPLPAAVVLVAATAHYSWEKIVRALGIGANQLVFIPVDDHYRLDADQLWQRVRELSARRVPILACISVCGTTEESAVDRLDLVLDVRARAERELGVTFHLHSDACYGGYAASLLSDAEGRRKSAAQIRHDIEADFPSDELVASLAALARADSITIDPHKLGYVPYPAGAILFRDRRARDLVAIDPPYLLPTKGLDSAEDLFLGRFVFEGSKPGAAAAAVWMSHKVLPLDERGYGYLISRTMLGARKLHAELHEADFAPFRIVLLPEPDINIVCYVLHHPSITSLLALNEFNELVYATLSLSSPGANPEYIITRTRFQSPMYDGAVDQILEQLGVCTAEEWKASEAEGLCVLRSTVMDPFSITLPPAPDHVAGLVKALKHACAAALS